MTTALYDMPNEILVHILSFLPRINHIACTTVDHRLYTLVVEHFLVMNQFADSYATYRNDEDIVGLYQCLARARGGIRHGMFYNSSMDAASSPVSLQVADHRLFSACGRTINIWNLNQDDSRGHINVSTIIQCMQVWGNRAYVGMRDQLEVWDLSARTMTKTWPGAVECLKVTASVVYAGLPNGAIKIWDTRSSIPRPTLTGHQNTITCIDVDSDECRLYSGCLDRTINIVDLRKPSQAWTIPLRSTPTCLQVYNNHLLFASNSVDSIKTVDLTTMKTADPLSSSPQSPLCMQAHDGYLYVGTRGGVVHVLDLAKPRTLRTYSCSPTFNVDHLALYPGQILVGDRCQGIRRIRPQVRS